MTKDDGPDRDRAARAAERRGEPLLHVARLVALHDAGVHAWHQDPTEAERLLGAGLSHPDHDLDLLYRAIGEEHLVNIRIWHEEDEARRTDVPDGVVAAIKRRIDVLNQNRNDIVERIDEEILRGLERTAAPTEDAPLHSETAGAIIDRLSILALKIYHMAEEAERADARQAHRSICRDRRLVLGRQRSDLASCLADLLHDAEQGRRRLPRYHQFKMYNDPELNPALRRATASTAEEGRA